MESEKKLGVVGCGNMGEAISRGIINSDVISGGNLYFYDVDKDKSNYLKDVLNANAANSAEELVHDSTAILLAIKPQDVEDFLKGIWHVLDSSKLVISIAAGISIKRIKQIIKEEVRLIRVMPNMPALTNEGISALCYGSYATDEDKNLAREIFMAIGSIVEVKEDQMDAVTAISGSGPAYFFYLIEVLEKTAIEMGIEKNKAKELARKTAAGSIALLKSSDSTPEGLRRRVTSKGGTTEAAFKVFSEKKLGEILREGIKKAAQRAKELSGGK